MRYFIALILIAIPLGAWAVAGQDARFSFNNGVPATTADATDECTNNAKVRFDFSQGVPAIVYDSSATCAISASQPGAVILYIKDGSLYIKDADFRIKE